MNSTEYLNVNDSMSVSVPRGAVLSIFIIIFRFRITTGQVRYALTYTICITIQKQYGNFTLLILNRLSTVH